MLNHQRELTLLRLTAAPTATSSAYCLTLQILWRQASVVAAPMEHVRLGLIPPEALQEARL